MTNNKNKNSWDATKRDFYDALKNRKDEIEQAVDKANEEGGTYAAFSEWYTQAWPEWQFLTSVLGGTKDPRLSPFDYCRLIHIPAFEWTDAAGTPHHVEFMGTHSPDYYGFTVNTLKGGAGITVKQEPATETEPATWVISADGLADGNVGYDEAENELLYKKDGEYTPITKLNIPKYIELVGHSGTLTDEQLETLLASERNYIKFKFNEEDEQYEILQFEGSNTDNQINYSNSYAQGTGIITIIKSTKAFTYSSFHLAQTYELEAETERATKREDEIEAKIVAGGKVKDVQVEGTSVLDESTGIANIIGLAKQADLTTEIKNREVGDTTLQGNIDIVSANLASEVSTRQTNVETLTNDLNSEITRAKAAETTNATAISAEETRAKAAEKTNADAIDAETTRAQSVEDTKIDLLGQVPGTTQEFNLPYFFYVEQDGNKLVAHCKTVTLDNNKTFGDYSLDAVEVDGATIIIKDKKLSAQIPSVLRLKGQYETLSELQTSGEKVEGNVYFVGLSTASTRDMYCYIDGTTNDWIQIGTTSVDLTLYLKKTEAASTYATITSLTTETTNRTSADTTLQSNIDTEVSRAEQAEKDISSDLDEHTGNSDIHVTASQKTTWTGKQDALTATQLAACNSGITSTKVGTYDGYATSKEDVSNKTDTISSASTAAQYPSAKAVYDYHDSSKLDATKSTIQTTEPTAAITDGGIHIVYLDAEPTTYYDGYIYLIKEA